MAKVEIAGLNLSWLVSLNDQSVNMYASNNIGIKLKKFFAEGNKQNPYESDYKKLRLFIMEFIIEKFISVQVFAKIYSLKSGLSEKYISDIILGKIQDEEIFRDFVKDLRENVYGTLQIYNILSKKEKQNSKKIIDEKESLLGYTQDKFEEKFSQVPNFSVSDFQKLSNELFDLKNGLNEIEE